MLKTLLNLIATCTLTMLPACQPVGAGASPASASRETPPPATLPVEPPEWMEPVQPPGDAIPHAPPANGPQLDPEVEALLERLERSAGDLTAFTADVTYEKEDSTLGRRELRTGNLIYSLDQQRDEKSFAILFDTTKIGNRLKNELKHYIFNGRWLAEVDHANKQFIKREIVPPGQKLDPLKLGEGPFPLPVGQPKAEVLARFDVTKADLPKEGLLKDLQNVQGLLLVPKPHTPEAKEFAKVQIYYDLQTLLPVGINAIEANTDRKTIKLTDIKRNPQLDESQKERLNINEPDPREWRVDVRPWADRE